MLVIEARRYYACEECLFIYPNEKTARDCEDWCREHGSCNMDITSRSLGRIFRSGSSLRLH